MCFGARSGSSLFALHSDLFHDGLDQGLGAFDAGENGLEVEGRLGGVAGGGAVDAVLADHDEGVGEQVHGHGKPSSLRAHHEFIALQLGALFVEYRHESRVMDEPGAGTVRTCARARGPARQPVE
jgi:hypothetical protein